MPLTDTSKSKVSLASLSATTAAAAESLWSKSKKSARKKQQSSHSSSQTSESEGTTIITPEVLNNSSSKSTSSSAEPISISNSLPPSNPRPSLVASEPVDRQEFRRKFLEGLQFYCENSSLILNSDLPADLIEFVTSHGFSVESLGIILELKKSSSAFSAYVNHKKEVPNSSVLSESSSASDRQVREQNFSEISRRLLQNWMSADSCAEAFVSLSLGEEIPGLIAECASFQRILFSVPDNFHIPVKDFITFLLSQLILAIYTLSYGIRKSSEPSTAQDDEKESRPDGAPPTEPVKVRTQVIASFLDKVFLRYFSDSDYFYGHTDHSVGSKITKPNPFKHFITETAFLCKSDVIGRRLISKIFLHVGSHSSSKIAKVIFCTEKLENTQNVASLILCPPSEFLENNPQWKFILQSLPVKTATKSKQFWLRWAEYIEKESRNFDEFWRKCAEHWIILNKSSLVDEHSLFSATLAITALARQIKLNKIIDLPQEETQPILKKLELGRILQNVIHSLESINEQKRVCGMALAQIIADMQYTLVLPKNPPPGTDTPKKLEFDCKVPSFLEILEYYNKGTSSSGADEDDSESEEPQGGANEPNRPGVKPEVLDSDDDVDEYDLDDDDFPELGGSSEESAKVNSELVVDPRMMTLRSRKRKIPNYFSEILEFLLEGSKNEDEVDILRYIVVLKIPVLISVGVKIDSKMALSICKCLLDLEDGTSLEIPIQLALYELFMQHPFEIADGMGYVVFDTDHYALGQRLMNLSRLTQILLISSKQACFNCYSVPLKIHERELLGIYPEFIQRYFESRKKLRFCNECRRSGSAEESSGSTEISTIRTKQDKQLTWREIVDQRVAAKTRYFCTPRSKTLVSVPDDYSTKLLPILWSAIANRLTSKAGFYLDNEERVKSGNMHDMFLVKVFQYLTKCVLGSSGPNCPHIRNIASHAGELVTHFVHVEDAIVRRNVLSLLGVTLSVGEGKIFVIEALSSQGSVLNLIDNLLRVEKDLENQNFIKQIQKYFAGCTAVGLLEQQLD